MSRWQHFPFSLWSWTLATIGVIFALGAHAHAADTYFRVPLEKLEIVEGKVPLTNPPALGPINPLFGRLPPPFVVLEHAGEAFVGSQTGLLEVTDRFENWQIVARSPPERDIAGRLYMFDTQGHAVPAIRFRIPAQKSDPSYRETFLRARLTYYDILLRRGHTGAAWFRHQMLQTANELAVVVPNAPSALSRGPRPAGWGPDLALELFTGQRALAENLALDRQLDNAQGGKATVSVDAIRGIKVAEIDWKPLLPAEPPALDRLAALLPADQHAVFFPSFAAVTRLVDEYGQSGASVLALISAPRYADTSLERYQRQMGVTFNTAARLLGTTIVRSVAMTGGDPYFDVGTDVAMLFETAHPDALRDLLLAAMRLSLAPLDGVTPRSGTAAGIAYAGFASDDRTASGYVAVVSGAVVLTNSIRQVEQLGKVARDPQKALAQLDEFRYFRERYRLGDADETALLFLSDATIRRWCSPRWRIGALRRTQALAELAELQAEFAPEIVRGKIQPRAFIVNRTPIELGELSAGRTGARSATYNTLAFATPIGELPTELVTSFEIESYERWRVNYERNWRWAFDPIGLRLTVQDRRLAADLTILPLIAGSEYRDLIDLTRGAAIPPGAGDRHGAIIHGVLALRRDGRLAGEAERFSRDSLHAGVLGWLGPAVAIYLDDSPLWDEMAKSLGKNGPLEYNAWSHEFGHRVPLGMQIDVTDRVQADFFLSELRKMLEPLSAAWTKWETRTYREQSYTRIATTPEGERVLVDKFALHVANLGDAIVITIAEETLKQAIDRRLDRKAAVGTKTKDVVPAEPATEIWAGRNAVLELDGRALSTAGRLGAIGQMQLLQFESWENLPILNEWKRIFPDRDPVEVHEQLWHVHLICPAGGKYVWSDEFHTLESTAVGHPLGPRVPLELPKVLEQFQRARLGLTFENQGLRAEVLIDRKR